MFGSDNGEREGNVERRRRVFLIGRNWNTRFILREVSVVRYCGVLRREIGVETVTACVLIEATWVEESDERECNTAWDYLDGGEIERDRPREDGEGVAWSRTERQRRGRRR